MIQIYKKFLDRLYIYISISINEQNIQQQDKYKKTKPELSSEDRKLYCG